jgi:hypothetical protein
MQTALQYLIDELTRRNEYAASFIKDDDLGAKALAMEKEQIKAAYFAGIEGFLGTYDGQMNQLTPNGGAEDYYNKTYKP